LTLEIIVVNNEKLSPQEELVNDLVFIIHVFSCKIYSLRKYKKQIKKDEKIAKELQDGDKPYAGAEANN
jgi:predicted site-specific integrase-resolvase